ncbi:MAG: alginate lyase family protein [Gemmatimonadaceae bacterium]
MPILRVLQKLRGRSLAELRERAGQRLAIIAERARVRDVGEPTDAMLRGRLVAGANRADLPRLAAAIRDGDRPAFFPGVAALADTTRLVRRRWPGREGEIIRVAEEVLCGRFSLLGHESLSFGEPIDWAFDPLLRVRAPCAHWSAIAYLDPRVAGDHKLVWELNRHQFLVTLGQAYALTGDERYATRAAELLASWMDANPPKDGVNWASSLEVAYRSIAWTWALRFFRGAPSMHDALIVRMLKFLDVSGRHLQRFLSTYFSPNTHLTGEALGLLYIGTQFPELKDAPAWTALGWRILTSQLSRQVRTDGTYFEQATYYHRYTCDIYIHARILGQAHALGGLEQVDRALERLATFHAWTARADGTMPLFGDEDGGRLLVLDGRPVDDVRATVASIATVLRQGRLASAAGDASDELAWMLGSAGVETWDALSRHTPPATAKAFPDGGFFIMRDGWDAESAVLTFDCGPLGAANGGHAHADTLAIDLAIGNRAVFVDAGTVSYTTSPAERDTMRSSLVHNTLTLDGVSSSEPAGAFQWRQMTAGVLDAWSVTRAGTLVEGHHDGYERLPQPARHSRMVLAARDAWWIIRDLVESTGEHDAVVTFQCAAGLDVSADGDTVRIRDDGRLVASVVALDSGGRWVLDDGIASRRYGSRELGRRARYALRTRGNTQVVFVVNRGAQAVAVSSESHQARAAVRLRGATHDDLVLFEPAATAAVEGVRTDARVLWLRRRAADGRVESLLAVGGSMVELDGVSVAGTEGAGVSAVRAGGEWRVAPAGARDGSTAGFQT